MYLGDWVEDSTHDFTFTTVNTSGVPTTLAGTPAISIYKDNNTTQTTTGITLTANFDTVTGLNHVRVVTTDAFYAASTDYMVVITTGTVGGSSVVGYTVATFSVQNRFMRGTDSANTTTPPTVVAIRQEMDSNSTQLAAIAADTNELQTDDIPGLIGALNDLAAAEVNTEVRDVIFTDTIPELSQAKPAATPTVGTAIMLGYMTSRNKLDVTSALLEIHNDAGAVIAKKSLSDDGTTYSEAEMQGGP